MLDENTQADNIEETNLHILLCTTQSDLLSKVDINTENNEDQKRRTKVY